MSFTSSGRRDDRLSNGEGSTARQSLALPINHQLSDSQLSALSSSQLSTLNLNSINSQLCFRLPKGLQELFAFLVAHQGRRRGCSLSDTTPAMRTQRMIPMVRRLKNNRRQANGPNRFAWPDIFWKGSMAGTYMDMSPASDSELQGAKK